MIDKNLTTEQIEDYYEKLISKFKQDPKWELKQEFGKMLMRNVNDFTIDERNRYKELKKLLNEDNK